MEAESRGGDGPQMLFFPGKPPQRKPGLVGNGNDQLPAVKAGKVLNGSNRIGYMLKNLKTGDDVGSSARFGDVLFHVRCLGIKAILSRHRGEIPIPRSHIKECPATLIQKLEAIPESNILPKMKERLFHFSIRPAARKVSFSESRLRVRAGIRALASEISHTVAPASAGRAGSARSKSPGHRE